MPICAIIPAKEIQAYKFEELSDNAKYEVTAWLADDELTIENVSEAIQYTLEQSGIDIDEKSLEWDIDRSQVCAFKGDFKELDCLIQEAIIRVCPDNVAMKMLAWIDNGLLSFYARIDKVRHYREPHPTVEMGQDWSDPFPYRFDKPELDFNTYFGDIQEYLQEYVNDAAHDALKAGQEAYEWAWDEENIADTCEANGYLFDKSGKPIHHMIEEC